MKTKPLTAMALVCAFGLSSPLVADAAPLTPMRDAAPQRPAHLLEISESWAEMERACKHERPRPSYCGRPQRTETRRPPRVVDHRTPRVRDHRRPDNSNCRYVMVRKVDRRTGKSYTARQAVCGRPSERVVAKPSRCRVTSLQKIDRRTGRRYSVRRRICS